MEKRFNKKKKNTQGNLEFLNSYISPGVLKFLGHRHDFSICNENKGFVLNITFKNESLILGVHIPDENERLMHNIIEFETKYTCLERKFGIEYIF